MPNNIGIGVCCQLTGSDMTTPRPRNERDAKPARPESNSDWARMPPSLNVVFSSGASER